MENYNSDYKSSHFKSEDKKFTNYLFNHVATAKMACKANGIPRENACRYKRSAEIHSNLWMLYKAPCKVTGRLAWYLTTNPDVMRDYFKIAA